MFPQGYLPDGFLPDGFFPGVFQQGGPGGAYPGGFFPKGMFPRGMFPIGFFPGVDAVTPPIDLPPTFPHAVRDCLMGDGMIVAALKGGLWWREAPAKRPGGGFPYAVYSLINERQTPATNHGDFWHTGLLRFAVTGKSEDTARRIADRMVRVVTSADLEFRSGWLMELRPENPTTTGRPERAPGGANAWTEVRALYFMISRRIPYPGQPGNLP